MMMAMEGTSDVTRACLPWQHACAGCVGVRACLPWQHACAGCVGVRACLPWQHACAGYVGVRASLPWQHGCAGCVGVRASLPWQHACAGCVGVCAWQHRCVDGPSNTGSRARSCMPTHTRVPPRVCVYICTPCIARHRMCASVTLILCRNHRFLFQIPRSTNQSRHATCKHHPMPTLCGTYVDRMLAVCWPCADPMLTLC